MSRCLFCVMSELSEGNHAFVPEDICDVHTSVTGIEEYIAAHPNGECSETCGCVSLEKMDRRFGWDHAARPEQPRAGKGKG